MSDDKVEGNGTKDEPIKKNDDDFTPAEEGTVSFSKKIWFTIEQSVPAIFCTIFMFL